MKFILRFLLALSLFTLPTSSFAHTGIESSKPEANSIVQEDTKEITLFFEGNIEDISTMAVTDETGQELELKTVHVNGQTITGELVNPLPKGNIRVAYNIISEDGHPLEGNLAFQVANEPSIAPSSNDDAKSQDQTEPVEKEKEESTADPSTTVDDDSDTNGVSPLIIVIAAVIVIGGIILVMVRKRNK
ncbi:copper resistance CopC family protein [Peribacillus saganii]|uniref:copper resistance CopC family protein n=1 Tax=Peribacillus saganii TaxID=2303992 RepID=UPI001314BDFE|nr:copper resistance CopC family protein [Peribacillus saganii]